jgi:hypothetical protein
VSSPEVLAFLIGVSECDVAGQGSPMCLVFWELDGSQVYRKVMLDMLGLDWVRKDMVLI